MAADLNAGVETGVTLDFEFKNEILEVSLAKESVGASFDGFADDDAILDSIRSKASVDLPTVSGLAVEEGDPFLLGARRRAQCTNNQDRGTHRETQSHVVTPGESGTRGEFQDALIQRMIEPLPTQPLL